jgi:hypothetical protein
MSSKVNKTINQIHSLTYLDKKQQEEYDRIMDKAKVKSDKMMESIKEMEAAKGALKLHEEMNKGRYERRKLNI